MSSNLTGSSYTGTLDYRSVAAFIFRKPPEQISKGERRTAKCLILDASYNTRSEAQLREIVGLVRAMMANE